MYEVRFVPTRTGVTYGMKGYVIAENVLTKEKAQEIAHEEWSDDPAPDKGECYKIIVAEVLE